MRTLRKFYVTILFFLIISCSGIKTEEKPKEISSPFKDTLTDPYHPAYYANKDPKEIGQLILEDKIRPTDDILTYRILDSLMAKKADDRKFYFQVFLKILGQADGALSEMIWEPASKYVFTYTEEFIHLSSTISNDLLSSWARFVGWQILSSDLDDPQKAGKRFIDQLNSNCKSCTTGEKSKLDSFNRMIIKSIEEGY